MDDVFDQPVRMTLPNGRYLDIDYEHLPDMTVQEATLRAAFKEFQDSFAFLVRWRDVGLPASLLSSVGFGATAETILAEVEGAKLDSVQTGDDDV